jgi:hypothetical protein
VFSTPEEFEDFALKKPDLFLNAEFISTDYFFDGSSKSGYEVLSIARKHGYKGKVFLSSDVVLCEKEFSQFDERVSKDPNDLMSRF